MLSGMNSVLPVKTFRNMVKIHKIDKMTDCITCVYVHYLNGFNEIHDWKKSKKYKQVKPTPNHKCIKRLHAFDTKHTQLSSLVYWHFFSWIEFKIEFCLIAVHWIP